MSTRPTRTPAIPAPTESNLLEVAKAIKGLLDVRSGYQGDELDRWITRRDVSDELFQARNNLSGGGGGGGGLVGPPGIPGPPGPGPAPDLTPPPAPTGVTATAALTSITIQWDSLPGGYAPNHAYAEIWRSADSLQGNAILIGTSLTRFFVDAVGTTGVGYHYWVRFRSKADVVGPFQGITGAFAQTGLVGGVNLAPLLITADKLAAGALEGINLIANTNAEAGTADWIADGAAGGGGTFGVDTANPGQGLQSFRLVKASGTATVGAVSRAFQVIPGESYAIRMLVRGATAGRVLIRVNHGPSAPAGDYMTAALRAGFTDVTQPKDSGGTSTDTLTTWTSIDVRYTVPAGQSWVSLAVLADGTGAPDTVWFDSVAMGRAIRAAALEAGTIAVGSAAIANGAIRRALIEDLAVDNAKIASLDAAKITTGFLDADRVQVGSLDAKIANIDAAIINTGILNIARIADGSITIAKIFEIIFSNNWDGVYSPATGGGPSDDPDFDNVVLLASFDGANGETSMVDDSVPPATLTAVNGAAISTAQSRFGGSSLLLDGTNDYVQTTRLCAVGSLPFTIEAWVRPGAQASSGVVVGAFSDNTSGELSIRVTNVGSVQVSASNNSGSQFLSLSTAAGAVPVDSSAWAHVALTRNAGGLFCIWVNGVPLAATTAQVAIPVGSGENDYQPYLIGASNLFGTVSGFFNGHIDEVRITEGVCRYTSAFTVPTTEPPGVNAADGNFSSVVLLLLGDGTNGSTSIVDSSSLANSASTVSNVAISTATPKFGTGSLLGSSGAQLIYGSSVSFNRRTTFTLEFWIRRTGAQAGFLMAKSPIMYANVAGGEIAFTNWTTGSQTAALTDGVWHHIALAADGTNARLFRDGVLLSTFGVISEDLTASAFAVYGVPTRPDLAGFNGNLEQVRWTQGVCRYTAAFTPPSAAFPTSGANPDPLINDVWTLLNLNDQPVQDPNLLLLARFANNANDESAFAVVPSVSGPPPLVGPGAPVPGTCQIGFVGAPSATTVLTWSGTHLQRADRAFTAEFWTDSQALPNAQSVQLLAVGGLSVNYVNGSPRRLALRNGTQSFSSFFDTPTGEIHVALVVPAGNLPTARLYVNGLLALTYGLAQEDDAGTVATATDNAPSIRFWIDDLRLTVGEMYTADFTPPARGSLSPQVQQFLDSSPNSSGDASFGNVELLLHMDGPNGGNAFVDSGPDARTVTANGSAAISATSPRFGSGALLLSAASSDHLVIPSGGASNFGTGEFTVEAFVRPSALFAGSVAWFVVGTNVGSPAPFGGWRLMIAAPGTGGRLFFSVVGGQDLTGNIPLSGYVPANAWTHIVAQKRGANLELYADGALVGSTAFTTSVGPGTTQFVIGRDVQFSSNNFDGMIDEVRVTSGVARYSGPFTPPPAPFPDLSPRSYTGFGNAQITTVNPRFGSGALLLDGSGDYINTTSAPNFGTADFTIEGWARTDTGSGTQTIMCAGAASAAGAERWRLSSASGVVRFDILDPAPTAALTSVIAHPLGAYFHFAVTRQSGLLRIFIDGQLLGAAAYASSISSAAILAVGASIVPSGGSTVATNFFNGRLDALRITLNHARYTVSFTPPADAFPGAGAAGGTGDFSDFGTQGWAISKNGTAVFNNLFSRGAIASGGFGFANWNWPASGGGFHIGAQGIRLGRFASGQWLELGADGSVRAPGFEIVGGNATFSGALNAATGTFSGSLGAAVVNTENIVGAAVTSVSESSSSGLSTSVTVTVAAGDRSLVIIASGSAGTATGGGGKDFFFYNDPGTIEVSSGLGIATGSGSVLQSFTNPPAGTYTITATRSRFDVGLSTTFVSPLTLVVLRTRR